ncbi:acetyltransferase [Penicillium verhagenii]|uniref:acetyltransferase n=1 Tax=Penicillium verhagenii TaxID=1562060 RepID=UPI002544DE03|nr:acetyltransferase [Penicillium verhagenii]KAJ5924138.1 acetyltransferase [Penicillium verhagenii]
MASPNSLKLESLTLEDNVALTSLWFAAFTAPELQKVFPNTPGFVDTENKDENGRPRIAAYAKWDLSMPEERGRRYPPWHAEMPGEMCEAFFLMEEENRRRVMGGRKHYYLDTVATHPDYQRRGCGSMLVKWGCDLADSEGVSAYGDASKDGAPLYAKYGFVDYSNPGEDIASMARFFKEA